MVSQSTHNSGAVDDAENGPLQRVPIDQIRCYEHNPRHADNPEYQRIKDSIREQGVDQPLMITRRPGEPGFITYAGGNTRLQILKALYEETGEERFFYAPCAFRPWSHESAVLLAHLRENDLRASLIFIDKARAIMDFKRLLEEETEAVVSQRQLETHLVAQGYPINQARISLMTYAVERLLPVMPTALDAGLGRPQIERLRMLEHAAGQLWAHYRIDDDLTFSAVFSSLCERNDSADWELELLRIAVETELAEAADMDIQWVRMDLDAVLAGRALDTVTPAPSAADTLMRPGGNSQNRGELEDGAAADGAGDPSNELDTAHGHPADASNGSHRQRRIHNDLKSLRARAWTLASRLAQRHGMGELIKPCMAQGAGFVVKDFPDSALMEQLDTETSTVMCTLWWHLVACSDVLDAPMGSRADLLDDHGAMQCALQEEGTLTAPNMAELPAPGHLGSTFWRRLGDSDWQDYRDLLDTYWRVHRLAADNQQALWT